jgi:hypothetical protein
MMGSEMQKCGFMLGSPNTTIYHMHDVGLIFDNPKYMCRLLHCHYRGVANVPTIHANGNQQKQMLEIVGRA